jgi:hypothetical protein
MQDSQIINIDDIAKRIIPLTAFRRNPGKVFEKLNESGGFIITKDGKPLGKLLPLENHKVNKSISDKIVQLQSATGGFSLGITLSPEQINNLVDKSYEEMLS